MAAVLFPAAWLTDQSPTRGFAGLEASPGVCRESNGLHTERTGSLSLVSSRPTHQFFTFLYTSSCPDDQAQQQLCLFLHFTRLILIALQIYTLYSQRFGIVYFIIKYLEITHWNIRVHSQVKCCSVYQWQ